MTDAKRCGLPKDNGQPCGTTFGLCEDCGRCFSHCPHREEERTAARVRGADRTNRKAKGAGALFEELPQLTSHEAAEIWCDVIGRYGAAEIISSAAANAGIRAVNEWRQCHDAGSVSDRLESLMDALSEWRKTGDPEPVLKLVDGSS